MSSKIGVHVAAIYMHVFQVSPVNKIVLVLLKDAPYWSDSMTVLYLGDNRLSVCA